MPPSGRNQPRGKQLRQARKSLAGRYYQLLTGRAAVGSFLQELMAGVQRLKSSECWWCNSGGRQSRHHLFVECRA